jgi:hypothetical protein
VEADLLVDTASVKPTYHLVDVVLRATSSLTFFVPPVVERNSLCRGDMVKLVFGNEERMWVKVTAVEAEGRYVGELRNHPVVVKTVRYGDEIHFQARHVADILTTN